MSAKKTTKKGAPKMGVIDITNFAALSEDEQVAKVKELLQTLTPKRQPKG